LLLHPLPLACHGRRIGRTGRRRRRRLERPQARPRWGKGKGDQGDAGEMLTTGGEGRERPDGGELGRPVAVLGGGGAPVIDWRREAAQHVRLGVLELLATSVSTGCAPMRRIQAGPTASSARLSLKDGGARHCRAAATP
jgi:hypothetical protein